VKSYDKANLLNISSISSVLEEQGLSASIKQVHAVAGGCINACYKIETDNQDYFLKVNESKRFPYMFKIEADSLQILNETNTLKAPNLIAQFENQTQQYLLLEWIECRKPNQQFWKNFAENLAQLHRQTSNQFGLEFDNYIGSLKQSNVLTDNWTDFYIQQRIQPQVELAFNHQRINKKDVDQFEQLYKALPGIFPDEKPALIHGDLWNGNFLCNSNQEAVLIDPAIYYAHREMEIAFTKLFGGFHPAFYKMYCDIYPLEIGFQKRVSVYNLYSLLVHLNLFGGHYYHQVMGVVKQF